MAKGDDEQYTKRLDPKPPFCKGGNGMGSFCNVAAIVRLRVMPAMTQSIPSPLFGERVRVRGRR